MPQVSSLAYGSLINAFQSDKLKLYNYFNDDQHILYILLYFHPNVYQKMSYPHSLGGNNTVQGPNIIAATRGFIYLEHMFNKHSFFFKLNFNVHSLIACFNSVINDTN